MPPFLLQWDGTAIKGAVDKIITEQRKQSYKKWLIYGGAFLILAFIFIKLLKRR